MRIAFTPRDVILDPVAVVGFGEAARALARRLLDLDGDKVRALRGACGENAIIILGETAALPWAEGVTYLAQDPEAPRLLVSTMMRPNVAFDIFERAIARHAGPLPPPWAVVLSPASVFSVANATVIDRDEVIKWLGWQQ